MTIVGIDLGTSHSSLARVRDGKAEILPVPQLDSAHNVIEDKLLPSVFFHDPAAKDLRLPWDQHPPILGRYAREQAIINPDRAIVSAKSWLCYRGDMRLPPKAEWGGKSAKEVSTLLLAHLKQAFEHSKGESIDRLALTVPASFDPLARQLTEDAARAAGFESFELIEEPLAAFYAWLAANPNWNKQLKAGDSILVCDVGGGTSDFSLIVVLEENDELKLERLAVGRHLLLGGDNMDLALAHYLAQKQGGLDHWQFLSLQQEVRKAKEKLLSDVQSENYAFSVSSRSSSLFASTLRLELTQNEVQEFLVEGFFPLVDAKAEVKRASGLQTLGLPYEADPAISKHLAAFLRTALKNVLAKGGEAYGQSSDQTLFLPTHILFNGGVFKARILEERLWAALKSWGAEGLTKLINPDLDHAVALGAAYYAEWKESGNRLRVRTAAPRSYFIGIEPNVMSVPGLKPQLEGLCVLPLGTEEGSDLALTEQEFALWGGDEVRFTLFSGGEFQELGGMTPNAKKNLETVAEMSCQIEDEGDGPIPVRLQVQYDTTGTLALQMKENGGPRAWKLAFDIRQGSNDGP